MTHKYDYGDVGVSRPTASRRTHISDASSRGFSNNLPSRAPIDPMSRSMYKSSSRDERLNRSTSGSRQFSYKLDEIQNRLAAKNNMVMSFYKDKKDERVKTAARMNDSSHFKQNIQYDRVSTGQVRTSEKQNVVPKENVHNRVTNEEVESQRSRKSTRGQMTYLRSLKNSGENVMQTNSQNRKASKPLDVIYEDPYAQSTEVDPRQQEILNKYYLDVSRRHLRPSARRLYTPAMTPDNNIKFVNNGSLVRNPKPTKTPPPPLWGEESEIDETAGEPFYDPNDDPARNSKALMHLDSSRSRRQKFLKNKLNEKEAEEEDPETIIIQDKRPKGSKLKKKIVYVYDSSDSDEDNPNQNLKPPAYKIPQRIGSNYSNAYADSRQYSRGNRNSSSQYAIQNKSTDYIKSSSSYGINNSMVGLSKPTVKSLNNPINVNKSTIEYKHEPLAPSKPPLAKPNFLSKNVEAAPKLMTKPKISMNTKLPMLNSRRIRTSALQRLQA